METRELRIGNILQGGIVVESVTLNGINCYVDTEGYLMEEYALHQLHGEPLSADWLKRFGFIREDGLYRQKLKQWLKIQLMPRDGEFILIINGSQIEFYNYVHELQNIWHTVAKTELTLNH